MNTFTILAVAAVLVYTVSGTPCTDICGGQCALSYQACSFSGVFGGLCDTQNNLCNQACAATCGCADSCAEQCGGEYATCKGDGSNVLNVLTCGYNLGVCSSQCHAQCNFNLFAGIVNSLSGAGAA